MKIYIYSFINKINGHRYIGKTNNIERRKREHKSLAYNEKIIGHEKDCIWYKKIREYGFDNFNFEILEIANENNWAEREKYWIKYYNTYKGAGYNMTPGGEDGSNLFLLDEEEAEEVRVLLKEKKLSQSKIADKFNISETLVSNINQGIRYVSDKYNYPIRKNYKNGLEDYGELIYLLKNTILTFKEIAEKLNMGESTVKKINYGKIFHDNNIDYPIRPFDTRCINQMERELIYSNLTLEEIAKSHNKTLQFVTKVNNGFCKKELLNKIYGYPLRQEPVSTIPEA